MNAVWLSQDDPSAIETLLRARGWMGPDEAVQRVERAGEGNMNVTLRVVLRGQRVHERSVILKQARPWVAKYPAIPAPLERVSIERKFYETVADDPRATQTVASRMPTLLGGDDATHTLLLEDLGPVGDLSAIYTTDAMRSDDAAELAAWLRALHDVTESKPPEGFKNESMRALNFEHLFEVPVQENNGLDLDSIEPGLATAAATLREDKDYREQLRVTGEAYRASYAGAEHVCLLHGDFFPGSWLRGGPRRRLRVIDPEFAFVGPRAFDVGVAIGHFALAGRRDLADAFRAAYGSPLGLDDGGVSRFAATEVMRRLIGVAQLPLGTKPERWRSAVLQNSREAMKSADWEQLFADSC
ncbi:MAG: phosphotransferase [Planctomycetota bacterium]